MDGLTFCMYPVQLACIASLQHDYRNWRLVQAAEHNGPVSRPSATPASIGPKDLLDVHVPEPKKVKDPKEIWDEDEVTDFVEDFVDDGRECPRQVAAMFKFIQLQVQNICWFDNLT